MKVPRDLSGKDLLKALARLGYRLTRQTGSHMRLSCGKPSPLHITVPNHSPLKVGTLAAILGEVAARQEISREHLIKRLFDK